jgi:NAD(P)-dependent dehydrogenase (short-subunit alcohol dehydrogenase family)
MAWLWKQGRPTLLVAVGLGVLGYKALQWWRQANLQGQVVLLTGGSRGLGLALAREFARAGCRLVLCARDAQELERAQQHLAQRGADVLTVPCNVADQEQVNHLVERAIERFGRIDILVNNAGVIQVGPLHTVTVEDFKTALDVMFWGLLYPTLAVLPQMLQRGSGRIVNITSIGGMVSVPHLLPYNCAKFAAVGLSEGLRAELGREGIHVTTIVPGLMHTGSYLHAMFKGQQEREFTWFALGSRCLFRKSTASSLGAQASRLL